MSQFFESVEKIKYEGPNSENPLAFRHYNEDEIILGKSLLRAIGTTSVGMGPTFLVLVHLAALG